MRPSTSRLLATTGLALLGAAGWGAGAAAAAAAAPASHVAAAAATPVAHALATKKKAAKPKKPAGPLPTCDEIQGATVKTSLHWRIFRPHPSGEFDQPGRLWACRRLPGATTGLTDLGLLVRVGAIAGDLVQLSNSGRYNPETYGVDLNTGRFAVIDDYSGPRRELLGSGALVTLPDPNAPNSPYAKDPAYASFGRDDTPGAGYYVTAADGSAMRVVPEPASVAATTADWGFAARGTGFLGVAGPKTIAQQHFKKAKHPGVTVTQLPGYGYQLESRPARGGRPATLEIHLPALLAYDEPAKSDLVARLVPGSERETYMADPYVIVGRFLDHPGELRTRRWSSAGGRNPKYLFDLPAPGQANAIADDYAGDVAVATGDRISAFLPGYQNGSYSMQTQVAPGARDLAIARSGDPSPGTAVLYWTDAAGAAHREVLVRPG